MTKTEIKMNETNIWKLKKHPKFNKKSKNRQQDYSNCNQNIYYNKNEFKILIKTIVSQ